MLLQDLESSWVLTWKFSTLNEISEVCQLQENGLQFHLILPFPPAFKHIVGNYCQEKTHPSHSLADFSMRTEDWQIIYAQYTLDPNRSTRVHSSQDELWICFPRATVTHGRWCCKFWHFNPPFPTHFVLTQNATGWKIVSIDYFSFSPHFVRIYLFNFSKDFTRTERVTPNILSP